jgi:hypothetical protein
MHRPAIPYRHIKPLLAALLTSLVSPVALAGTGSCPTDSTTISSNATTTCTLNTNDSITINNGVSLAVTGSPDGALNGIDATLVTGINITNNGSISVNNTNGAGWSAAGILVNVATVNSLNNSGSITATSTNTNVQFGIRVNWGATITTLTNSGSVSRISVRDAGGGNAAGAITTLNNSGTITALDNIGTITTLNNSGTISSAVAMGTGTLNLTGTAGSITGAVTGTGAVNVNGTFTSGNTFSNGTFAIGSGGVFTQGHTVTTTGGFSNAGTHVVAAGTTANVTGNYSPASDGTFRSNVTNSTTFGKLSVSGTATLPATMKIDIVTGNNCTGISAGQTLASVISATGTLDTTTNSTSYTVTDDCSGFVFTATKNGNALDLTAASVVNGACGSAATQSFALAPTANLCSTGNAGTVSSANGQYSWTCNGTGGGNSPSCTANWASNAGTGTGTVVNSGNNSWVVSSASFSTTSPAIPPAGVSFPNGILSLNLTSGTEGSNATVVVYYNTQVPAGAVYWKYGKTQANQTDHWYQLPADRAVFAGDRLSVTLTLTDGGVGDHDLSANSIIIDPGGPGMPSGGSVTSVPTLSEWGMIILSLLLAGMTAFRFKRG